MKINRSLVTSHKLVNDEIWKKTKYKKKLTVKSYQLYEKVLTILGTRPEIIRLSVIIPLLDKYTNHKIVHTGQNYDYNLDKVFSNFKLRKPNYFLNAKEVLLIKFQL